MNLGVVVDDVSSRISERVQPANPQEAFAWMIDSIADALSDLNSTPQTAQQHVRSSLVEFAVRGLLCVHCLCPETDVSDIFLDVANAAQRLTSYLPTPDYALTPALYERLLRGLSEALQRSGSTWEDGYQQLVESVALAELAVALLDTAGTAGTSGGSTAGPAN